MVKSEKLLRFYYPNLTEMEILSALVYIKKLLKREDIVSKEEFDDLVFFFFEEDEKSAILTLQEIEKMYHAEYFKRRQN